MPINRAAEVLAVQGADPVSAPATIESLLDGLQHSAQACAETRTALDRLLATKSPEADVVRDRIHLWLDIISQHDLGTNERREGWVARAKKCGIDDVLVASL